MKYKFRTKITMKIVILNPYDTSSEIKNNPP
jgi:hypothetical protein